MQSSLCDGLPVDNYTCSASPSPLEPTESEKPQHITCTTQSQATAHYPSVISAAAGPQTYPPQLHAAATSSAQSMWPTPPATICEEYNEYNEYDYTYRDSSAGGSYVPVAVASSSTSPRSWSSDAHPLPFPQLAPLWKGQEQLPAFNMPLGAPITSSENCFPHPIVASPYTNSSFIGNSSNNMANTMDSDAMMQEPPPMTPDQPESTSLSGESPVPKVEYPMDDDPATPYNEDPSEGDDGSKVDEPYAQLIYRAFMSRDPHAMSLQEIYQWFRDNTDKAKGENKGWQNSIRHNLSMNHAFVKRDRRPAGSDAPDTSDAKKSTEWVLEPWAVEHGVQSTTRYRKGNSSRRAGSGSHARSHPGHQLSSRALSGRKGGIIASKTKATRQSMKRNQQHGILPTHFARPPFPQRPDAYYQYPDVDFSSAKTEPMTPPDAPAELYHGAMAGPNHMAAAHGSHGYHHYRQEYNPSSHLPQHQHPQHHQQHHHQHYHPHAASMAYSLENVSSVYDPASVPSSSAARVSGQAASAQLPPGYNSLFADHMGEDGSDSAVRVAANLNYSWGEGAAYQS